jgi:hypothetical protein
MTTLLELTVFLNLIIPKASATIGVIGLCAAAWSFIRTRQRYYAEFKRRRDK